jgi:hypothetical protein
MIRWILARVIAIRTRNPLNGPLYAQGAINLAIAFFSEAKVCSEVPMLLPTVANRLGLKTVSLAHGLHHDA